MTWVDGPMQSWFDIHEALRNGIADLRDRAHRLDVADRLAVERFTEDVSFFMDVLIVHSKGEDGIVFPMLRDWGIDVPDEVSADHHEELVAIYDIHTAVIELRFAEPEHDTAPAMQRIRQGLDQLADDLGGHIDWEDQHLAAQVLEQLDLDQQAAILTKIHADTPAWIAPRMLPWMISSISAEHRIALLRSWIETLPPGDFERNAHLIHNGVDRDVWHELAEAVPGLGRAVSAE